MKITTWSTWKANNKYKAMQSQDSTLGFVYSIEPTLKHAGFIHTRLEGYYPQDTTPRKMILDSGLKASEIVYYVYRHPRGYHNSIEVFYKS